MTSQPVWSSTDDDTASLLDLLADTNAIPEEQWEWNAFVGYLMWTARKDGYINQNDMRPLLRGVVKSSRIGAFYRRAALEGYIRPEGSNVSDDLKSRNAGKNQRRYRWLGNTT